MPPSKLGALPGSLAIPGTSADAPSSALVQERYLAGIVSRSSREPSNSGSTATVAIINSLVVDVGDDLRLLCYHGVERRPSRGRQRIPKMLDGGIFEAAIQRRDMLCKSVRVIKRTRTRWSVRSERDPQRPSGGDRPNP